MRAGRGARLSGITAIDSGNGTAVSHFLHVRTFAHGKDTKQTVTKAVILERDAQIISKIQGI